MIEAKKPLISTGLRFQDLKPRVKVLFFGATYIGCASGALFWCAPGLALSAPSVSMALVMYP